MKNAYLTLIIFISLAATTAQAQQFSLSTNPPLNGGNGSGGVCFTIQTNSSIVIDTLYSLFYTTSSLSWDVWYSTTDLSGPPNITTANGWVNVGSGVLAGNNTSTTGNDIQAIPLDINVPMDAGSTYRWYVGHASNNGMAYTTWSSANQETFTDGTITVFTGTNVGYGGNLPNPTFHPRQYNGRVVYSVPSAEFPYCESFEEDDGNWSSGGSNPTWEHGEPNNTYIDTAAHGTNAWVTDLDGDHNNSEESYVQSPIFDLSSLVDPVLTLKATYDLENDVDGVTVRISPDSGNTWSTLGSSSSSNWYNSNTVTSLLSNLGNANGWTGNSSGWQTYSHSLLPFANDTAVYIRFEIASDGSNTNEGFAFDDIHISETNDLVLVSLNYEDSVCGREENPIEVVVCNNGVEDVTGFTVDLDTNGTPIVYTYSDTLGVCACDTFVVADFSTSHGGTWALEAEVSNTGDVNPANDTLKGSMTHFQIPNVEVTGGGTYCEGDAVSIDYEFTGMSPWNFTVSNGTTTTSYSNVTSNPISLIVYEAGVYEVVSLDDATGCPGDSLAFVGEADVIVNPAPAIDLGPDVAQCGPYTMNAGGGLSSYNWSTGETTQTITVFDAGTYSVTVTDGNDCTNSDTIVLDLLPLPNITLSDTILCEGGTHIFNAGPGGASYLWDDGSTGQVRSVNSAGSVSVTVTGFNGCVASSSAAITQVVSNPNPSITAGNGYAPVTLDAGPGYAGYLWNTAATTQQILLSSPGSYTCTVTDLNGCKGSASGSPDIWATGVEDVLANEGFALFPNPADHITTLRIDETQFSDDLRIELIDISGKVLLTQTNVVDTQIELSTENLSSGSYIVRLVSGELSKEQSLVVQH
ncbi:MAG: hypothetical protein Salg2KO_06120 [Salibacteraceae bacterium]